jgi:hypothetical protein
MIVLGVIFIVTMLWTPDGVLGVMRRLANKLGYQAKNGKESSDTKSEREAHQDG